jgi:hypothetical protein
MYRCAAFAVALHPGVTHDRLNAYKNMMHNMKHALNVTAYRNRYVPCCAFHDLLLCSRLCGATSWRPP